MGWVVRSEDQVIENIHTEDFEVDITYMFIIGVLYTTFLSYVLIYCTGFSVFYKKVLHVVLHVVYL